ncbi:MAG: hypothetical protein WA824_13350 [Candidatus Sulfotelmatobacter sp.]
MPLLTPSRLKLALLTAAVIFLTTSTRHAIAQDDPDDVSLGDLARSLRAKSVAIPETVIDNDNLLQVVDDAESRRDAGLLPVFSLDPGYNSFHVSSPDVTCSLTFTAKNASLSDQFLWSELPSTELSKLDGPAIIDGDTLQVTIHNGTSWELREVVIGLTIIRIRDTNAAVSSGSNAKSAVPGAAPGSAYNNLFQKEPDTTVLLRVKGSADPSATAIFRTTLNFALFPDQEWHWAIVKAKGIPPQAAPVNTTASATGTNPVPQPINLPLSVPPKQNEIVGIAPAITMPANADVQPQ